MVAFNRRDKDDGKRYRFTLDREEFVVSLVETRSNGGVVFKKQYTRVGCVLLHLGVRRILSRDEDARWQGAQGGSDERPGIEPRAPDSRTYNHSKVAAARKRRHRRGL